MRRFRYRFGVESLEDRITPDANSGLMPRGLMPPTVTLSTQQPEFLQAIPTLDDAFDAAGHANRDVKSRIEDSLLTIYQKFEEPERAKPILDPYLRYDAAGNAFVRVTASDINAILSQLNALGFQSTGSYPNYYFTEGWLPVGMLPRVEHLPGLMGVTAAGAGVTNAGVVTSQGDWVMQSDFGRSSFGVSGIGQRVGVLSDSYNALGGAAADISSNDLSTVQVIQDAPTGTDEGRAMLQVVHDIATSAGLAFATASTGEAGMAANIAKLANAAQGNCGVIVDDMTYFDEPMFQHGVIAQAISTATSNGKAYFSAAGNFANQAYESTSIATATDANLGANCYDFNTGSGVDTRQLINLINGAELNIELQWDQPFYTASGVTSDVDIYIVDSSGATLASSTSINPSSQLPKERVFYRNTTVPVQDVSVVIKFYSGPLPGRIKWVNYGSRDNGIPFIAEWNTTSSTVTPHAAIAECEGVAATPYFNMTSKEDNTSKRGNVFLFSPDGSTRYSVPFSDPGPYIAGVDGANTTFFGTDIDGDAFKNFTGTSAAAAHAAGVAALLRGANTALGPFSIYNALETTADTRTGTIGWYSVNGLVRAYDALAKVRNVPRVANLSVTDGFESGSLNPYFSVSSSVSGRVQVTSSNSPFSGGFHVAMASEYGALGTSGYSSLNQLDLHFNAAGAKNLTLKFAEKELNDGDNPLAVSFTNSFSGDGVAFSVDGVNWFRLVSLTGTSSTNTYQYFSYDLAAAATAAGVTLSSDTRVRFQQYDNYGLNNGAGITFDNISISRDGTVTGSLINDANGNGSIDGGETGIAGRKVFLDSNNDGVLNLGPTYSFNGSSVNIPDTNTLVGSPLTVAGVPVGPIIDVDVTVNLTHPYTGDLQLYLLGPSNTKVQLFANTGDQSDNILATFDDSSFTPVAMGYGPFTGRYRPAQLLNAFNGLTGVFVNGIWTLQAIDASPGFTGMLNSWNLTLTVEPTVSNATSSPIADLGFTSSAVSVSGIAGPINDVNVTLNLSHTFDRDLLIELVAPNGERVSLANREGSSGDNFTNTVFDDSAPTNIAFTTAPFIGSFRPDEPLSSFNGLSGSAVNGTWTLEIRDLATGDTGTLLNWSLGIGTGEEFAVTDASGAYTFTNETGTQTLTEVHATGQKLTNLAFGAAYIVGFNPVNTATRSFLEQTDPMAPTVVSITSTVPAFTNASSISYTATFSEPVYGLTTTNFGINATTVTGTSVTSVTPVTSTVYTITMGTGTGNGIVGLVYRNSIGLTDASYNPLAPYYLAPAFFIDRTPPAIANITSSNPNGTYNAGAAINITLNFSESVTLSGTLNVTLDTGAIVSFSGPFTGTSLSGTYTVAAGQSSADLNVTSLALTGGSTLQDAATNAAVLTLPANNLANNKDIVVGNTGVTGLVINNGSVQRSRLTSVQVNFSAPMSVASLGAISFTRTAATGTGTVGTVVNASSGLIVSPASGTVSSIMLSFQNISSAGVNSASLADGRWQLSLPGVSYLSPLNDPSLRRLDGDNDGNGTVNAADFADFGNAFNTSSTAFDYDNNGTVNALDFAEFGNRFGVTL